MGDFLAGGAVNDHRAVLTRMMQATAQGRVKGEDRTGQYLANADHGYKKVRNQKPTTPLNSRSLYVFGQFELLSNLPKCVVVFSQENCCGNDQSPAHQRAKCSSCELQAPIALCVAYEDSAGSEQLASGVKRHAVRPVLHWR